ncbi:unnamed protein product, partial [Didymodactylos carnosus]
LNLIDYLTTNNRCLVSSVTRIRRTSLVNNDFIDSEQSSYEEIAATIPNKDDPSMPCLTFKSCLLSFLFIVIMSMVHQIFWYYKVKFAIYPISVILLSYPLAKLLNVILPRKSIRIYHWNMSLNPTGHFTVKEHTIIAIAANVCWNYRNTYFYSNSELNYYLSNMKFEIGFFLNISIQLLGYGLAGLMRKFLVWPSGLIWPSTFPIIAALRTLHDAGRKRKQWKITYSTFFLIALVCQFIYCWFPHYIMIVLTAFSLICIIRPNNLLLAQITGDQGLGLGSFVFDWYSITQYLGSPVILPTWALWNILVGFIIVSWIMTPIIYYTNTWYSKAYPIAMFGVLIPDNKYKPYVSFNAEGVKTIVGLDSNNQTVYQVYQTGYMSAMSIVSSSATLACLTAVIVHTILYHSTDIREQFKTSVSSKGNDVHCKLMSKYPDIRGWWFLALFLMSLIVSLITVQFSSLMPWYDVLLAILVAFLFVLPFGILTSITGQIIQNQSVAIICMTIGSALLKRNSSLQTFKAFSYTTFCQTLYFVSNMKLGHYMKIKPRVMFFTQTATCLLCSIISYCTQYFIVHNIKGVCNGTYTGWSCQNSLSIFDNSPLANNGLYFKGMNYNIFLWSFLIGAILPLPFWLLRWKFPNSRWLKYVHIPLMLTLTSWMPNVSTSTFISWLTVGLLCNWLVGKLWWRRYVYLFSAAMDAGSNICLILIGAILTSQNVTFPEWWGTRAMCPLSNADSVGTIFSLNWMG